MSSPSEPASRVIAIDLGARRIGVAITDGLGLNVTVLSYRNTVAGPDSITGVAASALASAGDAGSGGRCLSKGSNACDSAAPLAP